jgi:hypothetical protein
MKKRKQLKSINLQKRMKRFSSRVEELKNLEVLDD